MPAKIRIKCPYCGEVTNSCAVNAPCPKCHQPLNVQEQGSIYVYRQGSPYGIAGGFGLYINGVPFGHIGNRELLRIPVPYGTYTIHSAVGMSRKCRDLTVAITPECPVAYTKVYIKPGFWTNSFVVEFVDPNLLDL